HAAPGGKAGEKALDRDYAIGIDHPRDLRGASADQDAARPHASGVRPSARDHGEQLGPPGARRARGLRDARPPRPGCRARGARAAPETEKIVHGPRRPVSKTRDAPLAVRIRGRWRPASAEALSDARG